MLREKRYLYIDEVYKEFGMTDKNNERINEIEKKLEEISKIIISNKGKKVEKNIYSFFENLEKIKQLLGNFDMDLSYVACIMAQNFLAKEFGEIIDITNKSQGANGLDLDRVIKGKRVIAEIKTTNPCNGNNFGSNQITNIKKDINRLEKEEADYKYFFVTNKQTEELIKEKILKRSSDIKIINLI